MPIEFACDQCAKLLRVPDGSEGRSCECPGCHVIVEIPDPSKIAVVHEPPSQAGAADNDDRLVIACPNCDHGLRCDQSLLGTKGQCRACGYIFIISETGNQQHFTNAATPSLVFHCPDCNQLFEGHEQMRGRKGKCHQCGAVFPIELTAAPSESPALLAQRPGRRPSGQGASLESPSQTAQQPVAGSKSAQAKAKGANVKSLAKPAKPDLQIQCSNCAGVLEVPGDSLGKKVACPFCETVLNISTELIYREESERPLPQETSHAGTMSFDEGLSSPPPTMPGEIASNFSAPFPANASLGTIDNPYTTPSSRISQRSNGGLPSGRSAAVYVAPGVALIVVGVLGIIFIVASMILRSMPDAPGAIGATGSAAYEGGRLVGLVLGVILGVGFFATYIAGGIAMCLRRNLFLAKAAAIVACIPCLCLIVNIPFGIWAAIVLYNPAAGRDFR